MKDRTLWRISNSLSVLFVILIGYIWYSVDTRYSPNLNPLVDETAAEEYVAAAWQAAGYTISEMPPLVPTGVFIQSINFNSAIDVNLTGYIWQKYGEGSNGISRGFVFPEAIDSGSNLEPRITYTETIGDEELVGWYFETTLRQRFNYRDYPLDHKTVWMRIWHNNFDRQALLVPDLSEYQSTQPGDAFGLDNQIVLGNWSINETFFDYQEVGYDNNFGYGGVIGEQSVPELYFNIVIKRNFLNAFIINLVPLLTVAALLFATMMTVSADQKKNELLGFSTSGAIGVCSALFFVVMLAHIQVREEFGSSGIVYIEYFYFIIYLVIIAINLNTFLFATDKLSILRYKDNFIPKLLYWPVLLGSCFLVTYLHFS